MNGSAYELPAQLPPPNDFKGSALLAIYWIQFSIALIFVGSRFYARSLIRGLGWDDVFIFVAMILDTACTAIQTRLVVIKGAQSIIFLAPDEIKEVLLLFLIYQPLQTMAVCMARVSIAALLLRIVGFSTWRRYYLFFCIVSTFVVGSVFSITTFLQCTPIQAGWDLTIPRRCWAPDIWQGLATGTSSWNAIVDVCLAVLPVTTFAKLQMDKRKKVGLCILMGSGVVAAIAAAVKAWQYISIAGSTDFTVATYSLYAVAGVELLLIIVCACIPTLKPIYDCLLRRRGAQKRNNRFSAMPTVRQAQRKPRYQPLPVSYSDDLAVSTISPAISQPPSAVKGEGRAV